MISLKEIIFNAIDQKASNKTEDESIEIRLYHFVLRVLQDTSVLVKNSAELASLLHLIRFSQKYHLQPDEADQLKNEIKYLASLPKETRMQLKMFLLQRQMEKMNQFFQLISNILKSQQDTNKQIINNIRG
jgi:hypothetical protein